MNKILNRDYLFLSPIDLLSIQQCIRYIIEYEYREFGYIVTPNVDHIIRLNKNPLLVDVYNSALFSLCDSRIVKILAMFCSVKIPEVITGSDLTRILFDEIIAQEDRITIIGSDVSSIEKLKKKYSLRYICHYCPPMGFYKDDVEITKCIEFVQDHPSRFVFFAVGSPQQEVLAYKIYQNGESTGLGFCIGASINFLTGSETRAPKFVQMLALEWLFRLIQNPKRLWKRYLVENIKIFPIFFRCLGQKLTRGDRKTI
jgi:exopolysaccharide biosynthesis WecB/TagA/CpsF family protein